MFVTSFVTVLSRSSSWKGIKFWLLSHDTSEYRRNFGPGMKALPAGIEGILLDWWWKRCQLLSKEYCWTGGDNVTSEYRRIIVGRGESVTSEYQRNFVVLGVKALPANIEGPLLNWWWKRYQRVSKEFCGTGGESDTSEYRRNIVGLVAITFVSLLSYLFSMIYNTFISLLSGSFSEYRRNC